MRWAAPVCCAAFACAAALLTSPLFAQDRAPAFGDKGQLVVTGSSVMAISWTWWEASDDWRYALTIAPAVDLFVVRNLSLGMGFHFGYMDHEAYGADGSLVETYLTTFRWAFRGGANVPLSPRASWYPQLAVGFESVQAQVQQLAGSSLSVSASPFGYPSTKQVGPWVELFAPVLFHPRPHMFVGFGPDVFHDFGDVTGAGSNVGGQRTSVGVGAVVGTWWGGPARSDPPLAEPAAPPRFGDASQVVFTSEIAADASTAIYAGIPSKSTILTFAPGIDYFVMRHLSVGAALAIRWSANSGIDASNRLSVTEDLTEASGMLRVGVDFPLATWLSLYPRANLSLGIAAYDEKSGASENKFTANVISVGLYAPLLLHMAPHAFVGFGPVVAHDLVRAYQGSGAQNRTTSAGASMMVGGWID